MPETLRSAARVKINGRNKVHAKFLKIQPLQGLDTIGSPVEQKNSCFRDWRTQWIKIAMFRRSEKLALGGGAAAEVVATNSKGCDIGYALAANSCEGVNNVDACTVTALDATTAFAVPDPNLLLAEPVGFFGSGCSLDRSTEPGHSVYFGSATVYFD